MFMNFYFIVCFLLSLSLGQQTNKSTQCTTPPLPKEIKIVVVPKEPYVITKVEGNLKIYSGFAIDLIKRITKDLGITYSIYEAPDGTYGELRNGAWTGMIGEIISGKADLAVGDLQITAEREAAIDFSIPFMNTGTSILLKNQTNPNGKLLEMCASELLSRRLKVGTLDSGSARRFLRVAKDEMLNNISQAMESDPESFARSDNEGIKRVKEGMYAYFMDATTIDYLVAQNCDFIRVGELLNKVAYGFGMNQGSSLRKAINQVILKLEESLELELLQVSWWESHADCPPRETTTFCDDLLET